MTEAEIDASYDLPYTRLPHPKYKGKVIPAFEMIKFSVNIHRGCFGGSRSVPYRRIKEVHRLPKQGIDLEGSESDYRNAGFQGISKRFGRPFRQYVPYEGER